MFEEQPPCLLVLTSHKTIIPPPLQTAVLALFDEEHRPRVRSVTFAQVLEQPALLSSATLAWIFAARPDDEQLYETLSALQERHLPALLTREGEDQPIGGNFLDTAVIAPAGANPRDVALIIRTLMSQRFNNESLRAELRLLRVHHGGVVHEFGKIDEELRLAAKLQREFLPASLPDLPELHASVLYRPAGYVSGDIYDLMRLDENHVGIFLADAVGHGVPAALMTVYIKRSLHTRELSLEEPRGYRIISPGVAMAQLNRDLVNNLSGGQVRTATAVYGVLNLQTFELQLARAGHPYPLVLRDGQPPQYLKPDGAMLGVFPDEAYDQQTVELEPGDRLLMYSDGFEMAFPEYDTQGQRQNTANNHHLNVFENLTRGGLGEALDHLAKLVDEHPGSLNQADDLTALLLGLGPRSQPKRTQIAARTTTAPAGQA